MTAYDIAARLLTIERLRQRGKALAVLERIIDGGEPYYHPRRQETLNDDWTQADRAARSAADG
ncbi:hypothetical protein ACN28C_24170 [Plantactinospora sp. WMMC1484]|uniref:hypothetical protein n=1 Tax=Plantactinospora sp. WMMC1484 TaxID=3404122 RepID=UPI003BF5640A